MNSKTVKYILVCIVTFIIIFLMNFIGNNAPDRLSRALLTACSAVIGLGIGMWIYSRRDQNQKDNNFD